MKSAAATRGACVDAKTVFVGTKNQTLRDAAAERLARFVRYRRSVLLARETADAGNTENRTPSGDLQTVAARVRELVEVRVDGV